MIKPESNAPAQMQPWIRTTDKQIEELQATISRLETLLNGGKSVDYEQNFGISETFTFIEDAAGQVTPYSSGMNFTGDVKADTRLDVGGSIVVGAANRFEYDPETGEPINAIPNFEMTASELGTNPVTNEEYYSSGQLHMNDTSLNMNVNGVINGDGLSMVLSNNAQAARENIEIITASGDGSVVSYEIENIEANVLAYVPGRYVSVTGIDPAGYNAPDSIILEVDSTGTNLVFRLSNETTDAYVAGGYVTISEADSIYEGKLSVRGPGPNYLGATINQDGLFIGSDGGNPLTATTSITPGVISAPEVAASYLNMDGTKVFVTSLEPSAPADGDLWIDPSGSPLGGVAAPHAATHGVSGSDPVTLAQSQIVNLTDDLAGKANLTGATFTGGLVAQSLRSSFASAAARNAAITAPVEGMICYLEDVNQVTAYLGSAWFPIAGQMPFFDVLKTANQTGIVSSTITTITWPTAITNRGGFTVASNQVTVPHTGIYTVNAALAWDGANNAGNNRHILIYVNNSAVTRDHGFPGNTVDATVRSVWKGLLNAGDVVDVRGYQTSGSNMSIISTRTRLTISYDGP